MKLTVLLVALVVALASTATAAVVVPRRADAAPQTIDQCTTIDSPGHYVLGSNVTVTDASPDPCIEIASSDVVLDGQGHTVRTNFSVAQNKNGIATRANGSYRNVTVENVGLTGDPYSMNYASLVLRNATGVHVRNVTAWNSYASVVVEDSADVTVTNDSLRGGAWGGTMYPAAYGLRLRRTSDVLVARNNISSHDTGVDIYKGRNITVRDNRIDDSAWGVEAAAAHDLTVANNTFVDPTHSIVHHPKVGVHLTGSIGNASVRGNTITGPMRGVSVTQSVATGPMTIANNTVNAMYKDVWLQLAWTPSRVDVHGNRLVGADPTEGKRGGLVLASTHGTRVDVANNTITGNVNGIVVLPKSSCTKRPTLANVTVHGNDLANNTVYGIYSRNDEVLNATHNYWGASNGPSSPGAMTMHDPVTGAPANGDGDAVSGSNGTSNVHFDPWSNTTVAGDSSANNSTAA